MRLRALDLVAWGPFRGTTLDFGKPGIHVVLGRNEAGKSTTLRAILGLLFGIDHKTQDAHVHKTTDLRIGGTLEGANGERLRIVRRKGLSKTLLDADGNLLDDARLGRLLGGVTRETFAHAWGLDHDRLGAGAQALLDGKGDLGESLFDASSGGGGVQRILKELTEEAEAIYAPRGSTRPLNEALRVFADAKSAANKALSLPDAFLTQEAALKAKEEERKRIAEERIALETRRKRLAILRRRVPLERRQASAKEKVRELAALLGASERIDALQRRQATYLRVVDERRTHVADATRLGDQVHAASRRASVAAGTDPETLRLDARTQKRIESLLKERLKLGERVRAANVEIEKQERELARLVDPARPAAQETTSLVAARNAAQALGDIEARILTTRTKTDRAAASLASRAASPIFAGTLDELVALRLPTVATLDELAQRASGLAQEETRLVQRRADLDREAASTAKLIAASTGDFAPPDAAALAGARAARDAAWTAYRAAPEPARAIDLDRRVQEADAVADRMIREADRVTTLARLRSEAEESARQTAKIVADLERVKADRAALDEEHRALFADAGVVPRGLGEMRQWVDRHAGVVEEHELRAAERLDIVDDEATVARAKEELRAALGADAAPLFARQDRLADLLVEANARIAAAEKARADAEGAARRGSDLRDSIGDRRAARDRDATVLAETEQSLAEHLAPLGIGNDASSDEVTAAIDALRELFVLIDKRVDVEARAQALAGEVAAFEADRDALLAECTMTGVELLFARTKEARDARAELANVEQQLADIEEVPAGENLEDADDLDEELERQIDDLTQQEGRLREAVGGIRKALEDWRSDSQAAEAASTAQSALARIRESTERYCRARLAAVVLGREIERYREENQAPLLASTSTLFERLTLGAYSGVRAGFDAHDRPLLRCVRNGSEVEVEGLSDGTRDQLYLSLRLASLLRRAELAEPMPLVLDDVLIQLDDQRAAAALGVLAEVARTMQVLFFTHHARLVELAERTVAADELVVHHLGGDLNRPAGDARAEDAR